MSRAFMVGLAVATLIAALKIAVFNEEQLRAWHARTGRGPGEHPLLQPDPPYYGFIDATREQAAQIIESYFHEIIATRKQDGHAA